MDLNAYITKSIQAAIAAGKAINDVYHSEDFGVEYKSDKSPLTIADRKAHEQIMNVLKEFNEPILSEEGKDVPFAQRKDWRRFWVVDPLDGTKEFIKRNGEFTVNVALVESSRPVLGTIFVPDRQTLYFAAHGFGAYKLEKGSFDDLQHAPAESNEKARIVLEQIVEQSTPLPAEHPRQAALTIVGSRSHKTAELEAYVEEKRKAVGEIEFISAGSSLKICLVAEGRADIYPRLGPTMEWDTAAGQAIAEVAGATVVAYDNSKPLIYNKEDLLNPWFIVQRES